VIPQAMSVSKHGVVELSRETHADLPHHSQRFGIGGEGERDDLVQTKLPESEFERGSRAFGSITVAPKRRTFPQTARDPRPASRAAGGVPF
jgi:hypothetical protein